MNHAEEWRAELLRRVRAILQSLRAGDDVAPAERFRAEGFAEAGLALGFASAADVAQVLDEAHQEVFGASIAEMHPFGATDCVSGDPPGVRLPVRWKRAPVHPTTP